MAWCLIVFGVIMTVAFTVAMANNPDDADLIVDAIIILIVGVAPILAGRHILIKQKSRANVEDYPTHKNADTKAEIVRNQKNKTTTVKKKAKFSEVEKLRLLDAALGTGEVIRIKYHGGSNPGMIRDVTPVYFNSNRPHLIDCYCTNAQDLRSFNIDKIEILETNVQTNADIPSVISFTSISS